MSAGVLRNGAQRGIIYFSFLVSDFFILFYRSIYFVIHILASMYILNIISENIYLFFWFYVVNNCSLASKNHLSSVVHKLRANYSAYLI
jgi:hypothetical protein